MAALKGSTNNFYDNVVAVILLSAFLSCIGMTCIILACALPEHKLFWPLFVVMFYAFSVLPLWISRRRNQDPTGTNPCTEFALFLTAGIILSTFALPIILARSSVIIWTACNLTLAGNVIIYVTIAGYFLREAEEGVYGGMF